MAPPIGKEERQGFIRGFLSRLKFPQLFLVLAALFTVDMLTPDPILLLDEAILGVLAVMFGLWRNRSEDDENDQPPMKNITSEKESDLR
jgi:hypothetical protein